ncbi:MAG: PAS domain S-box protein, partial [Cyclobacteriaceae bacterium]
SCVLMDANFRVLAFNKVANLTALQFHNMEIKEGEDFREKILAQNRQSFENDFRAALRGETVISENELPFNKNKIWFECAFYPAKDSEGNIIGVTFTTSNIDQRKRAEEKIIANERFFESVLQSQHEMICRFLPDTTITFVNNAYCKELGYPKDKIVGQKFLNFVPKEQRKSILEGIKGLSKKKPTQTIRHKVITAQKQEKWHEWTDMVLLDEDGEIREFQSVGRDISDLIHSQANQERFRTIFENALHEIYLINPDSYQIYHANNAAVQNLELSVEAMRQMAYWEVLRLDYRKSMISKIKGLLSGVEDKIICEAEHVKSNGKAYPVETHLQKMCIEDEVFLVAICVDLSERKRHVASITKQNKILRDIAWIQSHMVRAPLANILGLIQILKEEIKGEEHQNLIFMMEQSAFELDKVIRNVASKTHIVEQLEKEIKN